MTSQRLARSRATRRSSPGPWAVIDGVRWSGGARQMAVTPSWRFASCAVGTLARYLDSDDVPGHPCRTRLLPRSATGNLPVGLTTTRCTCPGLLGAMENPQVHHIQQKLHFAPSAHLLRRQRRANTTLRNVPHVVRRPPPPLVVGMTWLRSLSPRIRAPARLRQRPAMC